MGIVGPARDPDNLLAARRRLSERTQIGEAPSKPHPSNNEGDEPRQSLVQWIALEGIHDLTEELSGL
jgi:hypothetical protein